MRYDVLIELDSLLPNVDRYTDSCFKYRLIDFIEQDEFINLMIPIVQQLNVAFLTYGDFEFLKSIQEVIEKTFPEATLFMTKRKASCLDIKHKVLITNDVWNFKYKKKFPSMYMKNKFDFELAKHVIYNHFGKERFDTYE